MSGSRAAKKRAAAATAAVAADQAGGAAAQAPERQPKGKRGGSGGGAAAKRLVEVPAAPAGAPSSDVIFTFGRLERGRLVRRYKRFLADVLLGPAAAGAAGGAAAAADGATVVHCPNTGPMTGLLALPLAPVWCSVSDAKGRKYAHTLEMIRAGAPRRPCCRRRRRRR